MLFKINVEEELKLWPKCKGHGSKNSVILVF